jgi:hypothetical protein
MSSAVQVLDTAGRRRSPATLSEFHAWRGIGIVGSRPTGRLLSGNAIVARGARFGGGARLSLGELSSATSGSLTVALPAAASELRGTGSLGRHEREQAPTPRQAPLLVLA